jgi:glycine/D-amino acid oxidase-like deaminating enzyme
LTQKVKYLIVGQGLSGTWLSYYLSKHTISYKIINDTSLKSASSVASGVINPVTGRRIVQTWKINTFLPFAIKAYSEFQQTINKQVFSSAPVLVIHPNRQMKESFDYRLAHDNVYLQKTDATTWQHLFNAPEGIGLINDCYWIDLNSMIEGWKKYLIAQDNYIEDRFLMNDFSFTENAVSWKNIEAEKIIFCDGAYAMNLPLFNKLPFAPNKGEALIVRIIGLPKKHIYKTNITIVPWKEDLFWVGSVYEWNYENETPSESFKNKMVVQLQQLLQVPFEIVDHIVGIRPANLERRPFVGLHPKHKSIAICNGMGTKGCSLAPYFAHQLFAHLESGLPIDMEADTTRFTKDF